MSTAIGAARKVTVILTAPAAQALDATVYRTGHTSTDVVNRAVLVYNEITQALSTGSPQRLTIRNAAGTDAGVLLVATAEAARPFWVSTQRRRWGWRRF